MSAARVRNVLRIPGRIVKDPTNLSAAYPYGGTELGLSRDAEFRFGAKTALVSAEEIGGAVVEAVYAAEVCLLAAVLREFDNDALSSIFPNTSVGTVSQERIVTHSPQDNATNRPGYLLSNKAFKLLFAPRSENRHPFVLIYNAIPALEEAAALQLSLGEEVGIGVAFWGSPDATGRTYAIGRKADLTL